MDQRENEDRNHVTTSSSLNPHPLSPNRKIESKREYRAIVTQWQ